MTARCSQDQSRYVAATARSLRRARIAALVILLGPTAASSALAQGKDGRTGDAKPTTAPATQPAAGKDRYIDPWLPMTPSPPSSAAPASTPAPAPPPPAGAARNDKRDSATARPETEDKS